MPIFGGDSTNASDEDRRDLENQIHHTRGQKDHSDSVIDPALRDNLPSPPSSDKNRHENDTSLVNHQQQQQQQQPPSSRDHTSMPLVEHFQMSSPRRHHFDTSHRHPSPPPVPPITTMPPSSHSPSPSVGSVDRSSNSTPHIRRSPPHNTMQPPAMYTSYQHDPPMMQSAGRQSNHFSSRAEPINHGGYTVYSHSPFDQPRYDHPDNSNRQPYPIPSGLPAHFTVPGMSQHPMHEPYGRQPYPVPGGPPPVTIVHTDDAATKLTEGIRRRCFNCCTTDTSTWRRSNLSPGKVLCNKCGLFERTHSRPRPDQFPHKRGPLSASTLRGRTPPSNQLPPIASTPYQYHHSSITPLNAGEYHPNTLPGLQTWHNNSSSSSSNGNNGNGGGSSNHGVSGPGGSGDNGSSSATGTPLLQNRRSTLDSPRMQHSAPRGRPFDDQLSSNAAESSSQQQQQPPSPPTSISRSSTGNGTGASSTQQESTSASHTPPPSGAARDAPV